jgi:hypothetical protein
MQVTDTHDSLTPAEIAAGMTPGRKREEEEASGTRDAAAIEADERARAGVAGTIIASASRFTRPLRWRGRVI